MTDKPVRSFYRVSRSEPSYVTNQDKFAERPADVSDEEWHAWAALSFYDSEENARRRGEVATHLGNRIIRYDIPEGVGIVWDGPDDEGHLNVWGDKEAIKSYLVEGWEAPVKRTSHQKAKGRP